MDFSRTPTLPPGVRNRLLAKARALGVDPADCLVVEDASAGLASGRAAGATTLGLRTTLGEGVIEADLVVADLSEVRFTVDADGVRLSRG